jgi:hypothetical protein
LSDALLKTKAKGLTASMGITDFSASEGWLDNFKKRHQIKYKEVHGESGAANDDGIALARSAVPKITADGGFEPHNVFNMDESGLFFKARPSRTYAAGNFPLGKTFPKSCICGSHFIHLLNRSL